MSSSHPAHSATTLDAISARLTEIGRGFYQRGWVLGTSGNFSAVLRDSPLELAITASGMDKGALAAEHILVVNEKCSVLHGTGRPSAETLLHVTVVAQRGAGAVLHTHSVWSTVLSDTFAGEGGLSIEGYEMLKGLSGVTTHEHREWLPILENTQDMTALARQVEKTLVADPGCHGFLLRRHGLYTWGKDLQEAARHVEILEFLLEATGRRRNMDAPA